MKSRRLIRSPNAITGIAGCCARAANAADKREALLPIGESNDADAQNCDRLAGDRL
jgi:hypothetical protein